MKTYKLSPEAVNKYAKPRVILYSVVAIIFFICLLLFLWAESFVGYARWLVLIIGILFWGYFIYWMAKMALNQRRIWLSYELQLNTDSISYKWQLAKSPIQIRREEVKQVQRIEGGGIRVIGERKEMIVSVSPGLDEFEEISRQLQEWMEIESISQFKLYTRLVILGSLFAIVMMYFNTRPPMLVTSLPIAFLTTSLSLSALILFRFVADKRLKLLSLMYALPLVVAWINIFKTG